MYQKVKLKLKHFDIYIKSNLY